MMSALGSHQFPHAALNSHAVLTLVVDAHLTGLAAEAVLCRVPCQKHHVLGCGTCQRAHRHTHTHRMSVDLV